MNDKQPCQFGLWPSSLSPRMMGAGKRLLEVQWDSGGETLVWLEGRSDRSVLVAAADGGRAAPRDLTSDLSVRARVGYGGGDFTLAKGEIYFAEAQSGRLYRQSLAGGEARPITPDFGSAASPQVSPDGRFVAYVHADSERVDRLAVVDTAGQHWPRILASGMDFYTQPRWSPDGMLLAFVAWSHPRMPWDGSSLFLASVEYGRDGLPSLGTPVRIAGGDDVAVFQPEFTPDGRSLVYVSDESGFGQLHILDLQTRTSRQTTTTESAEYGEPNWVQEMRTYALADDGKVAYAAVNRRGFVRLYQVDLASGHAELIDALSSYTDVNQPTMVGGHLAFIASSPKVSSRVVVYEQETGAAVVAARTSGETLRETELSCPVPLSWKTTGLEECHGLYYPPASAAYTGSGGRPPLVVIIHGGPTSQARASYAPQAQFFATRGYAVLYVNHRGSTGYGRDYMLKQRGRWGVVDVEDAVSGARWLAESGKVDGERMVIMGGSAGGYTVLQTLVDHPEVFAAGIALYGIANQFTLVADTHKFEERYSEMLIGPLPEAAALYRQRSPLFAAHKIKRPLAVFQGDKDKVVPKDQSDTIVQALQRSGTPHVYHVYEGEGHGFRRSETLEHFYKAVDAFLKANVIYR